MSYLDDLKSNQLLVESFYPVQNKVAPVDPLESLAEEVMGELSDIIMVEDLADDIDIYGLMLEADPEKGSFIQQYVLKNTLEKLRGQMKRATDAEKAKLDDKIAKVHKQLRDLRSPPPSPKGDISLVGDAIPPDVVKQAPPGTLTKVAKSTAEYIAQNPGKAVAIGVAAAAAITAGVIAYRKYLSKAARSCKGASNKSQCMQAFRQKALKVKIQAMEAAKAKCTNTSKPYTCRSKIDEKIQKIKAKIRG